MIHLDIYLTVRHMTFQSLCSWETNAKGAIYLTTKNGTFPITLTSLKAADDTTQQHTPKILSATAKNLSQTADQDYWGDSTDEILFSNYVNSSYDNLDATYMWKTKRSINDAVSKNITLVLENLLKNYENSQLPTHGKGKSLQLSMSDLNSRILGYL